MPQNNPRQTTPKNPFWAWMLSFLGAASLFALLDLFCLRLPAGGDLAGLFASALYLLSLGIWSGLFLSLGTAAWLGLQNLVTRGGGKTSRFTPRLLAALLAWGLLLHLNRHTLSGPHISLHPQILFFKTVLLLGTGALAVLLTGLTTAYLGAAHRALQPRIRPPSRARTRRPRKRALALILASGLGYVMDANLYRSLYPDLHLQLSLFSFIFLALALYPWCLGRGRKTWGAAMIASLSLLMGGGFVRCFGELLTVRAAILQRAPFTARWMPVSEWVYRRLLPRVRSQANPFDKEFRAFEPAPALRRAVAGELQQRFPKRGNWNLILLTIDTLRFDAFQGRRGGRPLAPRLQELAARSLLFTNCHSPIPSSAYAFSCLFSGRHPSCSPYALEREGRPPPWPPDLTLAGLFQQAGFRTLGVCAFRGAALKRRELFGHLLDGFQETPTVDWHRHLSGEEVMTRALKLLRGEGTRRFLLWIHLLDLHMPYHKHPALDFGDRARDLYDSELAYVDRQVGRFLDKLKQKRLLERTVVVATGDHGEAFGEHWSEGHGTTLFEEQLHVPLLICVPHMTPLRIPETVGLVDLLPTLAALFGLHDQEPRSGRSLWPLILHKGSFKPYAYAELNPGTDGRGSAQEALVFEGQKLILKRSLESLELYDLTSDPRELQNLASAKPRTLSRMLGLLQAIRGKMRTTRQRIWKASRPYPEGEASRLRRAFVHWRNLPAKMLALRLLELLGRLHHPTADPEGKLAHLLRGPLKPDLLALLQARYNPQNPLLCRRLLRLAVGAEATAILPRVVQHPPTDPAALTEVFILKALAGDMRAVHPLRVLLGRQDTPLKYRVAMALLLLGDETGLQHVLAACRTRQPVIVARMIQALGQSHVEALLPLAEEMISHPYWRYALIQEALAGALTHWPVNARRCHLEALLREVARGHQAERLSARPKRACKAGTFKGVQQQAAREIAGDRLVAAHQIQEAARTYLEALGDASKPALLVLKAARALELAGEQARARHLLEEAAAESLSLQEKQRFQRRVQALAGLRRFAASACSLALLALQGPAMVLPGDWALFRLTLKNQGTLALPGGPGAGSLLLQIELRRPSGQTPALPFLFKLPLGPDELLPGDETTLALPLMAPSPSGSYQVVLRVLGGQGLPQALQSLKLLASGVVLRVTKRPR